MFGRTLVHEFLFSYSHTEWNLLFLKQTPLWHEATWDKPKASIKTETEEEEEDCRLATYGQTASAAHGVSRSDVSDWRD